ncbi:MAG: DUF4159 domain-containing protein [Bacteroidales bacterium]|nr:DUF4159 domain-containing protein [Bacteroidales bacterium]
MDWTRFTTRQAMLATVAFVAGWQILVWGFWFLDWIQLAGSASLCGWIGLYLIGLLWTIYGVERAAQAIEMRRSAACARENPLRNTLTAISGGAQETGRRVWNPLDPAAWYYGRRGQRLRQSLAMLGSYTILFILLYLLAHLGLWGKIDPYELPAGGGQDIIKQTVQVQKIIKKKYVINPFSSILFNPPPIDQIQLQLDQETQNLYAVGQGADNGAGFGQGTSKGKVRFIRLEHPDRYWDKNFGIGGDRNMLAEYHSRTKQKVAEETEHIPIAQLASFPPKKSPPLVYIAGAHSLNLSSSEKKILKQYLTERHGMILGDNLGGHGFHNHFFAVMKEITGVDPVPIPRDDLIHRRVYTLPLLPVVVAHGGTVPYGWNIDGRWAVYYHPGALSDAWRDDHAGIKKEVYELCYQLGVNILYYAHREYNTWLQSQQP